MTAATVIFRSRRDKRTSSRPLPINDGRRPARWYLTCSNSLRRWRGQGCDQQCLDGVQSVLCLVEDQGGGRLEDVVGDLKGIEPTALEQFASDSGPGVVECRQAVKEFHVGVAGGGHDRRVDLVGEEEVDPLVPPLGGSPIETHTSV